MRALKLPYLQNVFIVILMLASTAHAADTRFGLDAELALDTNVNRTAVSSEEQNDEVLSAEAYAARSIKLSYRGGMVLRGGLRLREHFEFGDLSNIAALGRIAYRFQPSPGYTGAWFEIAVAAELLRHRDSALRDGTVLSGALSAGKHVTDRIRLGAGLGLDQREGRSGALYDLSSTRAWLTLDYRVTPRITVYGSTTLIRGDHVFTANDPYTQQYLIPVSDLIVSDPAFADAFGGAPAVAYRLSARTLMLDAGINVPLSGNQALDFGASWLDSAADESSGSYGGAMLRASYLHRFR